MILYLPFKNNANDAGPNSEAVQVINAILTEDACGTSNSAYKFNGIDSYIQADIDVGTSSKPELTISLWTKLTSTN